MPASLQDILVRRFGHKRLRPIQREIINRVMNGGDALVVMPTGSGKSLCYQLPALALPKPGTTLVFSPLIALMEDQVAALKAKKIDAEYINSTLSRRERERRAKRMAEGKYDLLYATPERMQKREFTEALAQVPGGINLLAVDEAHCISRWGHDLRPAYQEVGRFRRELGRPPTIALTATATPRVRADIRRTLEVDAKAMPLFATPIDRPNLALEVIPVWHDDNKTEHIAVILSERRRNPGTSIIYFARIKDLEDMVARLRKRLPERPIEIYHGRLAPRKKKSVYERFIAATPEEGLILCATNAFGMGVDKADIRFIIHAQVPGTVEAYYQEVGRAGRDGRPSRCVLLYASDDLAIQQQFTEWQNPSPDLLVRTAHAIEDCEHSDFDADELQLLVSGKARTDARGQLEYALISLEKRGVVEPTSIIGRYRFVRPLHDAEVNAAAIKRKRDHDLRRLLDIVKLTKSRDVSAFVENYFDLEDKPAKGRGRRRRGGRGRGRGSRGPARKKAGKRTPTSRKTPASKKGPTSNRTPTTKKTPPTKKTSATPTGDAAPKPGTRRRRRRRRRRGSRPQGDTP